MSGRRKRVHRLRGDLSSRAVTSQVLSTLEGLTSVFGMDTGVPLSLSPRKSYALRNLSVTQNNILLSNLKLSYSLGSRPRPISTGQRNTLLYLHLRPIYPVVFRWPYFFRMTNLILRGASCLDAFSTYPFQTWLLSYAPGGTTDAPAVCPLRSSRTRNSSSQISYAHDG